MKGCESGYDRIFGARHRGELGDESVARDTFGRDAKREAVSPSWSIATGRSPR